MRHLQGDVVLPLGLGPGVRGQPAARPDGGRNQKDVSQADQADLLDKCTIFSHAIRLRIKVF